MADEEKKKSDQGEASPQGGSKRRSRKGLFLGGGIVSLVAAAYIVSMVALPSPRKSPSFGGPFVTQLTASDVQVNLRGQSGQRYLVMALQAKYVGYDEAYVRDRVADPVYQARVIDLLIGLGRQKTMKDVEDRLGEEEFLTEIRESVDPLLFPIHVGNEKSSTEPDEESGIRPGRSIDSSTMRGGFRAHVIRIDGPKGEISLDDGPVRQFEGVEEDFCLENAGGLCVYVDLSELTPDWVGEVNVGTFGRVQAILKTKFLFQ